VVRGKGSPMRVIVGGGGTGEGRGGGTPHRAGNLLRHDGATFPWRHLYTAKFQKCS
jgi:hypothetical protein